MDAMCWLAVALCLALLVALCAQQMAADDDRKKNIGGERRRGGRRALEQRRNAPGALAEEFRRSAGGNGPEDDGEGCVFFAGGGQANSLLYGDATAKELGEAAQDRRASAKARSLRRDGDSDDEDRLIPLFADEDDGRDDGAGDEEAARRTRERQQHYGDAPSQRKPKPWHSAEVPLLSNSYYEVPGRPLDPYVVNVSSDEAAESKLYAIPDGLHNAGNNVLRASIEAAEPLPPKQIILDELGPQRMQRSTWKGQGPTYFDTTTSTRNRDSGPRTSTNSSTCED
jgi:hypothetical protein